MNIDQWGKNQEQISRAVESVKINSFSLKNYTIIYLIRFIITFSSVRQAKFK